jgi:hypothetical protein
MRLLGVELIKKLFTTLELLSKFVIVIYFVGNKHPSLYIVKGCELLYVCNFNMVNLVLNNPAFRI